MYIGASLQGPQVPFKPVTSSQDMEKDQRLYLLKGDVNETFRDMLAAEIDVAAVAKVGTLLVCDDFYRQT
jgi:hypothetical protein